ncbi:MAG: hypothetical protein WBJ37_00250 [Bacteroidales bacterium]
MKLPFYTFLQELPLWLSGYKDGTPITTGGSLKRRVLGKYSKNINAKILNINKYSFLGFRGENKNETF